MKHEEWIAEVKGWDKEYPLHMEVEEGVNPQRIIETLNEVYADRDTVFTSDVGQHHASLVLYALISLRLLPSNLQQSEYLL